MAVSFRQTIRLTENNIHNWVGEAQFNRGLHYVKEGLIVPYGCRGNVVRGWCLPRDKQPGSYYVWARLREMRICDAHCTCALGKYGICPHVAAVLVTFVRDPQTFQRSLWQQLVGMLPGWRGKQQHSVVGQGQRNQVA